MEARTAAVQQGLLQAFDTEGDTLDVIVSLRTDAASPPTPEAVRPYASLQDGLRGLESEGFTVTRAFGHVPAVAGKLTRAGLERLMRDSSVAYVQQDSRGGGHLKEAVPAIGGDRAKVDFGVTGKGVRVAVLDTGVVTAHPDLKDSIVAQHCFTRFDCGSFAAEGTTAEDDNGHGSNVTGIITSNGVVSSPGFAPDAEIVAVKVNDANDSGQSSDWVAGFDWVYDHRTELHVKVVNASLGTNQLYTGNCDAQEPALAAAVKNLVNAGIAVFVSSGNQGSSTQMAAPACNTGAIAVGATYDSNVGKQPSIATTYGARWGGFANCADPTTDFDYITCFTNSNSELDLVAPGAPIVSDSLGGKTEMYWGTSQASPAAAAVAALMLECDPSLSPVQIEETMKRTGVLRADPKNGLEIPSLRAYGAVESACHRSDVTGAGGAGAAAGGASGSSGAAGAAGSTGTAGGASAGGTAGAGGYPVAAAGAANSGGALTGAGGGASGGALPIGGGTGGAPGTSGVAASAGGDAGCGCATPGRARPRDGAALALGSLLGAALLLRRSPRRRTPPGITKRVAQRRDQ